VYLLFTFFFFFFPHSPLIASVLCHDFLPSITIESNDEKHSVTFFRSSPPHASFYTSIIDRESQNTQMTDGRPVFVSFFEAYALTPAPKVQSSSFPTYSSFFSPPIILPFFCCAVVSIVSLPLFFPTFSFVFHLSPTTRFPRALLRSGNLLSPPHSC